MNDCGARPCTLSRPRVLAVGAARHPLGMATDGLTDALARAVDLRLAPARHPIRDSIAIFRAASRAIRVGDAEVIHLLDARFAVTGMAIQRHFAVPVTATITSLDLYPRTPWGRLWLRAAGHLDEGFVSDERGMRMLRDRAPRLPLTTVEGAASALPWPSVRRVSAVTRAIRTIQAGRLIVAIPWPDDRNDLRWFRDFVLPRLACRPVCLLFGVPSRRQAQLMLCTTGADSDFRILSCDIDADTIAAVSRCVDVVAVPSAARHSPIERTSDLAIALSSGGVPVVTNTRTDSRVLAHERNAFVVDAGDEHGFVDTLNDVLSLPAFQRQALGQDFARFTLASAPWSRPAATYADRFAALVGRPQIPLELRAA